MHRSSEKIPLRSTPSLFAAYGEEFGQHYRLQETQKAPVCLSDQSEARLYVFGI